MNTCDYIARCAKLLVDGRITRADLRDIRLQHRDYCWVIGGDGEAGDPPCAPRVFLKGITYLTPSAEKPA